MSNIHRLAWSLVLASVTLSASAQNLLANGDFSMGNVGFTTDYGYVAAQTDALGDEGVYTLATNTTSPYVLETEGAGIANYSDHTNGNGLFMVVNGSTTFDAIVWQETLTGLNVGQTYRFDGWVSRWTPDTSAATAKLQVLANDAVVTTFQDPGVGGVWAEQSGLFTATATSMTLQIRDLEDAANGNDFGLDDLSVTPTPEPAMMASLGIGAMALIRRRRKSGLVQAQA